MKLFPSEEDALEFLEDHGLDEAHIKLLRELGRILEAARIHAGNGDMLKAVEMLTAPTARNVDRMQPMIEYLLTGLRQGLTLGVLPTSNSVVSKLLVLAGRLDKSTMTGQEANEVSLFHPFDLRVSYPNISSLRCLKQSNALTVQTSVCSPRLSLRRGKTRLPCCA